MLYLCIKASACKLVTGHPVPASRLHLLTGPCRPLCFSPVDINLQLKCQQGPSLHEKCERVCSRGSKKVALWQLTRITLCLLLRLHVLSRGRGLIYARPILQADPGLSFGRRLALPQQNDACPMLPARRRAVAPEACKESSMTALLVPSGSEKA